jgi:hypothetical protein
MPETCWDGGFDGKHRISCILLVLSLHFNISTFLLLTYCSAVSVQSSCPVLILLLPSYISLSIHVSLGSNPFSLLIKLYRLMERFEGSLDTDSWQFGLYF